ncbi:MAG: ABC transporter permease subunit [Sulfolobales archaeon]
MRDSLRLMALIPICFVLVFLLAPVATLAGLIAGDPLACVRYLSIKVPPDGEILRVYKLPGTKVVALTGLDFGPLANTVLLGLVVSSTTTLLAIFSATSCLGLRGKPRVLVGYAVPFLASVPTPFISAYAITHLFHREFGILGWIVERLVGYRITFEGIAGVLVYQVLSLYPLSHLVLMAYVDLIDRNIVDSARVLGARGPRVIRDIVIPLSKPAIIVSWTLTFVLSCEDLSGPVAFSRYNSARNLMAYIAYYDFVSEYGYTVSMRSVTYVVVLSLMASAVFTAFWRNLRAYRYPVVSTEPTVVELGRLGVFAAAITVMLQAFSLLPKVVAVAYSITDGWYGYVTPRGLTLSSYVTVFTNAYYLRSLLNTVVYSTLSVALVMFVASISAYVSLRSENVLSPIVEALTALPVVIPGIAVGIGYFVMFHEALKSVPLLDPLTNPAPYLVLAYASRRMTYAARPLSAAIQKISKSMEEQALNLGAGQGLVIRTITLPLVPNAFVVASFLASIHSSTEFSVSLVLTGGYGISASHPVPVVPVVVNMLTYNPASIHVASALLVSAVLVSAAASAALALVMLKLVSGLKWRDLLRGLGLRGI